MSGRVRPRIGPSKCREVSRVDINRPGQPTIRLLVFGSPKRAEMSYCDAAYSCNSSSRRRDYSWLYMFGILTVGLLSVRRIKITGNVFFLAGRSLSWPFVGAALFASNISTIHLVGLTASGYNEGLVWGNFEWMASYTLILLIARVRSILFSNPHSNVAGISGAPIQSRVALILGFHGNCRSLIYPHRDELVRRCSSFPALLWH